MNKVGLQGNVKYHSITEMHTCREGGKETRPDEGLDADSQVTVELWTKSVKSI